MLSPEERKVVSNTISHMQLIADETEIIDDLMSEVRRFLQKAKGPSGEINNVTMAVVRQKSASILNSLARCVDEVTAILEEF